MLVCVLCRGGASYIIPTDQCCPTLNPVAGRENDGNHGCKTDTRSRTERPAAVPLLGSFGRTFKAAEDYEATQRTVWSSSLFSAADCINFNKESVVVAM